MALLLVAFVATVAWIGVDGQHARADLRSAASQVRVLQAQVARGDRLAGGATLRSLQKHAAAARSSTHGPQWTAGRALPWLGPNIHAVQTVSEVIDDLALKAMPALVNATSLVDPSTLAPVRGRVDLAPLVKAAPQVELANAQVQTGLRRLDAVSPYGLAGPVSAPLADLRTKVGKLALTTATAARSVRLLPPMLGSKGPREYLLLVQNNAEPRATGGIPGAVVRLRADNGAVKVVEQRSGNSLKALTPVLPLTTAEEALFGEELATDMRDVTFTPDFPRSGQLARAIWRKQVGGNIDGVLSVDPGTLSALLGATGPVALPTGQLLTAQNAIPLLLNTMYLNIADPVKQDAVFASTASSVFDAVLAGQGDPAKAVGALAQAAREGRFMVWSAHEDEQALLAGTVLSGDLVGVRGKSPVIGVFLNDGTAAKIGYYLHTNVVARTTACRPDGSQAMTVRVTLRSTAPKNAAQLPKYITGGGNIIPAGEFRTNVLLYPPKGGMVNSVRASSGPPGVFSQNHNGLAVIGKTVQLRPGSQVVIDYDILTGKGQRGIPTLRVTPVIWGKNLIHTPSRC
jgi:Protein of unknown function (DUF4012)